MKKYVSMSVLLLPNAKSIETSVFQAVSGYLSRSDIVLLVLI